MESEHSYSGDAANFSIDARPGGCFCERLKDGSVAHMTVVFVERDSVLRMHRRTRSASSDGRQRQHDVRARANGRRGTRLQYEYAVGGYSPDGLEGIAVPVDRVQLGQLQRLQRYVETGNPAAPTNALAGVAFASTRRQDSAAFAAAIVAAPHFERRSAEKAAHSRSEYLQVVFIFGPTASGKLTIAREVAAMTGFRLFPDHLAVNLVNGVFDYGMRAVHADSRMGLDRGAARSRARQSFAGVHVQTAGDNS